MRFTTKTEYGLVCLVYLARHTTADLVTIKEIVAKERFSVAYIEKILQSLRAAHIVTARQGHSGGYSLARPASEITLKQIIEALEGHTFEVFCEPNLRQEIVCNHFSLCGLSPIWNRTKELLDDFYGSVTLEMITKEDKAAPHLVTGGEVQRK